MDLETLFTMSLVSTEMKALADVKMFKMKSKIVGNFVHIDEVQEDFYIGPHHLNRVMRMKTLNIAMDENNDLVCNVESAYIIRKKVVQCQQVATIKLCPMLQKPPEALDYNKVDQIIDAKFNMWMS